MLNPATAPLSVYIHIPWCVKKCPYCDFNSHENKRPEDEERYIKALKNDLTTEIELVSNREIQSIFFGGGTPSLFTPDAIHQIIETIKSKLSFNNDIEITMEANPGTFEQNNFADFKTAGVNRLSIGIQSFNDKSLENIGRIHDSNEALSAIETAKNAGFDNINLDLMFGLPEQSLGQAIDDIKTACNQDVQHISHYQLTIEPNTYFHKHPPQRPDTELIWDMQQRCHEVLNDSGYKQYEVSAFAKKHRQCLHNKNYWEFGDYIGIGAGAHGKLTIDNKIVRRWKHRQPEEYMSSSNVLSGESVIDKEQVLFEFLLNALRLREGFSYQAFENNTGFDKQTIIDTCKQIDDELIIIDDQGIQASKKGYLFLDEILQNFV